MANSNPNEITRFKPGQSGNPEGRPRGQSLTALLREVSENTSLCDSVIPGGRTAGLALAEAMFAHAIKGNPAFASMIWDRLEGKAAVVIETSESKATITPEAADAMNKAGLAAMGEDDGPQS